MFDPQAWRKTMDLERKLQSSGARDDARHFPDGAFDFVLEGLAFAVERVHGPLTPAQALVAQYMAHENIDLQEVIERHDEGLLGPEVCEAIAQAGGVGKLNRHVGGQELCWALRERAIQRWGPLASVVLLSWGVTCTADFGNMVYALIETGRLQREPSDRLTDFYNVFEFKEALDDTFEVDFAD